MPEPPDEYTTALNNLKAFRAKILSDLVGGRVKAGLDAQHESMQKYANVMDGLGVTPYLMGYIRHMVVALQFKGQNIGGGALRDVRAEYVGAESAYPMNPPYNVPQRSLPQVDTFVYTPIYDMELLDKTNVASLHSALLIQAESGTFRDKPDVENALYDYYMVYPNKRRRGKWSMVTPFSPWNLYTDIEGENIRCIRELIKADTYEHYMYFLILWLDAVGLQSNDRKEPFAIAVAFGASVDAPVVRMNVVGQRIEHPEGGIWVAWKYSDALRGFTKACQGTEELSPFDETWRNTFKLTMEVNDSAMGHTVPAVGEYTYEAGMGVGCHAYPHAGYKFDHWERDTAPCGESVDYSIGMYKDFKLKAFFAPV